MEELAMDKKLYEASIQGNVTSLLHLLHEDPLIIHKYIAKPHHTETPLHVAALLGHVDFVNEILARKPDLAREPNSEGSTALHLAAATGHVEIVRFFLKADIETCTVLDRFGMNPVHVAAVKGRVKASREMVRVRPDAARMVTGDGLTVLHLCVKYNQFVAIKLVVEVGGVVDEELVNFRDHNTVLHLAVLHKQTQTVKFLLTSTSIQTESRNVDGLTASDISELSCMASIQDALRQHGCRSSTAATVIANIIPSATTSAASNQNRPNLPPFEMLIERLIKEQKEQQAENRRNAIIIAATFIATMSFQVAANPPGGVWQDSLGSQTAGKSIMASESPGSYGLFLLFNTIAFCCSAFVFLMMISRLPFLVNNKYVIGAFNVALWLAIMSLTICFSCSMQVINPGDQPFATIIAAVVVLYLAFAMCGFILFGHVGLFIWQWVKICNARSQSSARPLE